MIAFACRSFAEVPSPRDARGQVNYGRQPDAGGRVGLSRFSQSRFQRRDSRTLQTTAIASQDHESVRLPSSSQSLRQSGTHSRDHRPQYPHRQACQRQLKSRQRLPRLTPFGLQSDHHRAGRLETLLLRISTGKRHQHQRDQQWFDSPSRCPPGSAMSRLCNRSQSISFFPHRPQTGFPPAFVAGDMW